MVLLDVIMPKMDGFSVLKSMREDEATKDLPVMLLTNLGQDEDIQKGKELGVIGYLIKANVTPAEVVESVKKELAKLKA
jgi:CheY-like chemotaxis protein